MMMIIVLILRSVFLGSEGGKKIFRGTKFYPDGDDIPIYWRFHTFG